ncbi:MAG TPA: alpha/beta hydrolase [Thermoleophilaceae bacterium]|jgi:pimeloyl-ACP methyl ester carboxylesterase|nr:alpha/beta hydrolase [Thermoleophilaceae bacterium]
MSVRERADPYTARFDVPVIGGGLRVVRAGPPVDDAERIVLAVHGVTASLMTWRTLARELDSGVCMLAPDLRGRGRSSKLPGPYGIAQHVADLIAVLDHVGAPPVVLVGHSMGAYIAERLAAEHPERASGLVLLDAGLPFPLPENPREMLDDAIASTVMRLAITFPSAEQYVAGWRAHPAFSHAWNDDVEAYARYDLGEDQTVARCNASLEAVRTDSAEMMLDDRTRLALDRVHAPVQLLRAERGLFDADPLISADELHTFADTHPSVRVEEVADVNHYTLVMGASPGPARVAAAIGRAG